MSLAAGAAVSEHDRILLNDLIAESVRPSACWRTKPKVKRLQISRDAFVVMENDRRRMEKSNRRVNP